MAWVWRGRFADYFGRYGGDPWRRWRRRLFGPAWRSHLAGHDQPLQLVHHLGEQVECLGVLFPALRDNLRRRHHLPAEMAHVLSAVLDAAGRRLHGAPELVDAPLFGELGTFAVRSLLVSCMLRLLLASVLTRSSRAAGQRGMT